MKTSNAVGNLIDACLDDKRMLEHESRVVGTDRAKLLRKLATERSHDVEDLRGVLSARDKREHGGSWAELGRELGRGLRVALGFRSEGDSIAACRQSCMRTMSRFDQALDLPLAESVRAIVVEQRARLDSAHEALRRMQF
jgi:hypothetical protein